MNLLVKGKNSSLNVPVLGRQKLCGSKVYLEGSLNQPEWNFVIILVKTIIISMDYVSEVSSIVICRTQRPSSHYSVLIVYNYPTLSLYKIYVRDKMVLI
jgi:hypothetical protein